MAIPRATFSEERALKALGFMLVAGVDEAGMGAWAGPVVAAAVILPDGARLPLARDSKALSPAQRARCAADIKKRAVAWAVGLATHAEIDQLNIRQAGLLAMRRAVEALAPRPDHLLLDAFRIPHFDIPQKGIIRGDRHVKCIAAASVIAKTHRDALMGEYDAAHPGYGFSNHKGYGTAEHQRALAEHGPCPIHRLTYEPVRLACEACAKTS
jgi:ribonuclease HII